MIQKLRHPMRLLCVGTAAYCAVGALTGTAGTVSAVVAALIGVVLGELLARRRLRLWVIASGALLLALVGIWIGIASTKYEAIPSALGPASALRLSAILRFGATTFALITALRAAGRRMPALAMLEIAVVAGAFAIPFAAHRDGVLVRPLWLSDWAWHEGVDPAVVLLAIGAVVGGSLALLLMFESERRPSAASFLALPGLAALAAILFAVSPPPPPRETNDLGLTQESKGDPPKTTPPDKWGDRGNAQGENQQQQQGQGGQQQQGQQQQGQGGGQQQQQDGQGGATTPPAESDWQEPSEGSKSAPMAIVLLGDDYTPPTQMYYFRQEAWSQFAGTRLVAPRRRDVDADVPRDEPNGTLTAPSAPDAPGNLLMHADVALMVQHRRLFFLGAPTTWQQLSNPDPQRIVRAYRFESVVTTLDVDQLVGHAAGNPAWSTDVTDYYLQQSADPRFAELAEKIVSELPDDQRSDPFVRAAAIKRYLDKNLTYSTKHRHANVPDPTADFMFGDRIGYCVHFAHAAVFLFRAAGVPARIGVGYAVEADNLRGSSLLIRGGDAHAWPELYLDGIGWTVLDIAAAKNLDPPGQPPDDDMQLHLADLARGAPPDPFQETVEPRRGTSLAAPAAIAAGALLLAFVLALYSVKTWRRWAPRFAAPHELPRVGYRAALDLLSDTGRRRKLGETRETFADRVEPEAPAFHTMTDLHLAARLGPPPAPAQSREEWRALHRRLRRELAGRAPWWRRLLGALDPISFRSSR
jgi:transglutaminase-like putative cysteine protease